MLFLTVSEIKTEIPTVLTVMLRLAPTSLDGNTRYAKLLNTFENERK